MSEKYTHRNEMAKHTTDDYYEIVKDIKNWVHRASAHLNYLLAKKDTLPQGWDRDYLINAINSTHFHDNEHADEYRDGGRFAYKPKMKTVLYSVSLAVAVEIPEDVDTIDVFDSWDLEDGEVVLHDPETNKEYRSHRSELADLMVVEVS